MFDLENVHASMTYKLNVFRRTVRIF